MKLQWHRLAAPAFDRRRAAPAGGALSRGWGCSLLLACLASQSPAQSLTVPSGQFVEPMEYLSDADGVSDVLRARYHAPELQADADIDVVFADMAHLCESDAVEVRDTMDVQPPRIIVSLSSAPLDFGEINAEVTQFFEAYRVENGRCIWELF